jgi:CBS domain-containing protein
MTVAKILAAKGRDVVTTAPSRSVAEAVAMLARRKIGALVVVEDGDRIVGIISERDIVRLIATKAADALDQPISAIMTKAVMTCGEGETIDSVMARMTRGRFRHLPVVGEGRLTGIVSIGDVVKARIEQVEHEAEEMRAYIATA